MTNNKYFYTTFKRDNPREHYFAVLDALDELSMTFVSALEMAEFLKQCKKQRDVEKRKSQPNK